MRSDDRLINPIALAKRFHELYEKASKETGWVTQANCQVKFHELPEANREALVRTCIYIMKEFDILPRGVR